MPGLHSNHCKSSIEYKLVEDIISDNLMSQQITYGISLWIDGKLIRKINDISLEQNILARFIKKLNDCELSPIHLSDVIDDFLAT